MSNHLLIIQLVFFTYTPVDVHVYINKIIKNDNF